MPQTDADKMGNNADPDQTSSRIYTVCPGFSILKVRKIMVHKISYSLNITVSFNRLMICTYFYTIYRIRMEAVISF